MKTLASGNIRTSIKNEKTGFVYQISVWVKNDQIEEMIVTNLDMMTPNKGSDLYKKVESKLRED